MVERWYKKGTELQPVHAALFRPYDLAPGAEIDISLGVPFSVIVAIPPPEYLLNRCRLIDLLRADPVTGHTDAVVGLGSRTHDTYFVEVSEREAGQLYARVYT